jgi:hypothetical protein
MAQVDNSYCRHCRRVVCCFRSLLYCHNSGPVAGHADSLLIAIYASSQLQSGVSPAQGRHHSEYRLCCVRPPYTQWCLHECLILLYWCQRENVNEERIGLCDQAEAETTSCGGHETSALQSLRWYSGRHACMVDATRFCPFERHEADL